MHVEVDRLVDAAAARRAGRRHRARAGRRARRRATTGSRWSRGCRKRSPSWSAAPASLPRRPGGREPRLPAWLADDHFTLLGYRQHDLVQRATARTRCASCPAAAWACCARPTQEQLSASFAALPREARALAARAAAGADRHQVEHALHRAPAGLPRLHRRQALRRQRRGDRRAPLPRPVHLHRLQRPGVRDPAAARQGRGDRHARRPAAGRPPGQGAATTSWRPIRATSCSRSPTTTCTRRRWASWPSASASGCACSCGATRSSASSRA